MPLRGGVRPAGQDPPSLPAVALPGEQRVLEAAQRSLRGERRGLRGLWPFLGPAFIAAIAYVDPGNFATNIAAGSQFGYMLLWVILVSNLMAMLVQTMSAKLGIATGMNLAEVGRERFRKPVRIGLWLQAEVIAMATDLAEFVGAALGSTCSSACRSSWPASSPARSPSPSWRRSCAASAASRP